MITHIARLGKIIGQYSPEELDKGLADGLIKGGDHWWRQGMKDWKLVSAESPLIPKPTKAIEPETPPEGDWRVRPKHKPSLYGDEPATEKQLALIRDAGLTDLAGLTKYDASRWLDLILGTDDGRKSLNENQFKAMQDKQEKNEKAGLGCDGHRTPSGQYRSEIKFCLNEIAEKKTTLIEAVAEYPEDEEELLADFEEEKKEYEEEIDRQMEMRVDYWLWVIQAWRDGQNPFGVGELFSEDALSVDEALTDHLFTTAKKIAVVPSREKIKQALLLLDASSLNWDDDHPDLLLTHFLK